ncbi:hypothetical protein PVAND_007664 [Polypedilum vanderplanki]|uniref:folate gamma-glutamyl hydrolase n=1 Tax=Polypedilum vanderplanki TaxID=319348 RepID=A0A9J6C7N0_POLVA|nr:hypothetical protein PVAND_007664 [Polypedilum vanderplanki]
MSFKLNLSLLIVLFCTHNCIYLINGRSIISTDSIFKTPQINNNPIIGILAEELLYSLEDKYPDQYHSYIASSYVKFVEGGGARVVPVWIGKPREYYEDIMSKLNGILFPGGSLWFNQTNGYSEAGMHIYEIAEKMNDEGDYFPIWGTCLGFELLTYLSAKGEEHRVDCSSNSQSLPLIFKDGFHESRMFKNAPSHVIEILRTEPVTSNFHQFCVTEKNLTDFHIDKEWHVISVNDDWNGLEFISTIENYRYPFYGIQFHPEKNLYEWVRNKNISHTTNAVIASQYFAEFFVSEARKNDHHFADAKTEDLYVIYNYPETFTGAKGSSFEQCYMFPEDVDYVKTNNAHVQDDTNV